MLTQLYMINRVACFWIAFGYGLILNGNAQDTPPVQDATYYYELSYESYRHAPDEAIRYGELTAELAIEEGDGHTLARSYFLLGYIYDHREDIPNAFNYYFGSIRVYQKLRNHHRVQQLYENMSQIAERRGVHEIAKQLKIDRMSNVEELPYQVKADMHYDLALSYKNTGEIEAALDHNIQALLVLEEHGDLTDTTTFSNIWLELGILHYMQAIGTNEMHWLDSSLMCYEKARHFNSSDSIHLSKIENNLGNVSRLQGNFQKGKEHLFRSIELSGGYESRKIGAFYNLGRIYFAEQKKDSAIWAFTRSLEINIKDLNYHELSILTQLNIELTKTPELFGAMSYLDSIGAVDLEIKGKAIQHVYQMARDRYLVTAANNRSMLAQLYDSHSRELKSEAFQEALQTWSLIVFLVVALGSTGWFWWRQHKTRKALNQQADDIEKRLHHKYGIRW